MTEKALSVSTTCFVFVIIMSTFAVPREYQQKVLLIGIVMALLCAARSSPSAPPRSTPTAGSSTCSVRSSSTPQRS